MLRAMCLATTLLVLPMGSASAAAPSDPCENAALVYWQAFATLPKFTEAEGQKINGECLTMPLDAQAREFVSQAGYSLDMLHHAVARPRCDWGLSYEEGIYTRLPHAMASRELSALACLRSRLNFGLGAEGNAKAIDDLVATVTLSRQISLDGTLIMVLVGYAIEARANEALAAHLNQLDAATLQTLKTRLDALPAGGSPSAVMKFEEKSMLDWLVGKVKKTKNRNDLVALLGPIVGQASTPEGPATDAAEQGRAFIDECGGTAEGVIKYAEATRPSFALMAKKLSLPVDQFEKEFAREKTKLGGNPVFRVFFASLDNVRRAQARSDVRRALLSTALAVKLDGPKALANHPDPVIGGPFEYAPFNGGFELRSKLTQGDKPLSLAVGQPGK